MDEIIFRAALVGDSQSTEMSPVRAAVARNLSHWEVREFRGLTQLLEEGPADGFFPDLVMVCQRWRDEYSAHDVREGLATFPVARWICVYGAWCESEGRHGSRWPMAVRVPLRSLEIRLATEAAVVKGDIPALALTAARDEVFEFDTLYHGFPKNDGTELSVAIISLDRELRSWLSDLCRQSGLFVDSEAEGNTPANLLIVDLDPFTEATRAEIRTLRRQLPQAKILGLMGLESPAVLRELQSEGVAEILSKLTPAAHLLHRIQALAQGQEPGE